MVEHQTPEFSWVLPTPRYSWVGGVSLVRNWDNHGVWICQCAVWLFNGCKTYLVNMNTLIALTPFISASGHHLRPPIRSSSAKKKRLEWFLVMIELFYLSGAAFCDSTLSYTVMKTNQK